MNIKLTMYSADLSSELSLPFADQGVRAGFPSPAQDYMTDSIDLNRELIRHPATTLHLKSHKAISTAEIANEAIPPLPT